MDVNTYINSGILELYVAGKLTESENQEVYEMMKKHPEVIKEVLEIEHAIVTLTKGLATRAVSPFSKILNKLNLNSDTKVVSINNETSWKNYMGWAAAILIGAGLMWSINSNNGLQQTITDLNTDKQDLEIKLSAKDLLLEENNSKLAEANTILNVIRDKKTIAVPLAGQAVYPEAYANAYWDKENKELYLDLSGLPEPPTGKVYQIWSLTLDPLAPTDLGVVDDFETDDNKIFKFANANESQAFGITLEPAGGSKSPTLEQLYTLGIVKS